MLGVLIYVIFSGLFTFGVTHKDTDDFMGLVMKFILSIIFGFVMMPMYLGSWFDLNNMGKHD